MLRFGPLVGRYPASEVCDVKCTRYEDKFNIKRVVVSNRSNIEGLAKAGKPITRGGVEIRSVSDYRRAGVPRALTVEEVGEAFVQSMVKDKNGAVYAVFPDTPLIEFPDNQSEFTIAVGVTAMLIGSRLGLDVYKPIHFYTIAGIIVFLLIAVINFLISFIF